MARNLFRQPALDHQREQLYSDITFMSPPSLAVYTWLSVISLVVFLVFLSCCHYPRRQTYAGYLCPVAFKMTDYTPDKGEKPQQLMAVIYVPNMHVGYLNLGKGVRLRYQGLSEKMFGINIGKVIGISPTILLPAELPAAIRDRLPNGAYQVSVAIPQRVMEYEGRRTLLRPGMPLMAEVELENPALLGAVYAAEVKQ